MDWGGCREQPPLFEQYPHKNGKSFLHFVFDRRKKNLYNRGEPASARQGGVHLLRGVAQLVARLLWEQEAQGSSPCTPTTASAQSPFGSVSAGSLRLSAKTPLASLRRFSPHGPLRWARAGTPFFVSFPCGFPLFEPLSRFTHRSLYPVMS